MTIARLQKRAPVVTVKKCTLKMGTVLFISSQQGGFTPVNFASTSSESGNITNLCSNKSHLKKK